MIIGEKQKNGNGTEKKAEFNEIMRKREKNGLSQANDNAFFLGHISAHLKNF